MFEYTKIKAELEEFKCPKHGKSAIVSFDKGKLVVESFCCEEHKALLDKNLSDAMQKNVGDIIAEMF